MSVVKPLTPKGARKQDRRENAVYAVRQLNAIRATIAEVKLDGETDAVCVRRIFSEWRAFVAVAKALEQPETAVGQVVTNAEAESGLPNFAIL